MPFYLIYFSIVMFHKTIKYFDFLEEKYRFNSFYL